MASIVIADDTKAYDGTFLDNKPLGGTESAVIRFAESMARRGHQVTAYVNCERPIDHNGVRWMPLRDGAPQSCDIYIACQHPRLFGFVPRPRRRVVWVLWQPNEFKHYKQILRTWWYRPLPVFTSQHQVRIYSPVLPRLRDPIVLHSGLPDDIRGLPPLATPPPSEAIFVSNPHRNLNALLRIFAERILPRCPAARFHVYGLYDLRPGDDPWLSWGGLLPTGLSETARAAIRIHPTAARADLMAAVRHSRVMLYLGHKVEAFCFAAAEAQAMGVPCVVAPVAALPERVIDGETGFVRADPSAFADAAVDLLTDDALWRRQHEAALRLQQGLSWDQHAARFEAATMADMPPTNHHAR
jgi:glycosyltransferase involved in cell wall biosynthesis